MTDERTGRELTPRPDEEPSAITPREPALPQPSTAPVERFYAGDQAHTVGLTEERAAQIVRQSSNARSIAFLAVLILVLFIPIYWLFDIGMPLIGLESRLESEADVQYVTDVKRGHELYLSNCARCHGPQGQGGIGPPLNDQAKLYNAITPQGLPGPGHLNPEYLGAVLREGGRYVCGDPNSVMPAWEQPKGPLNYREVQEIITFMLATRDTKWVHQPEHAEGADGTPEPATNEQGWRDPNYTPPPGSTPVPECWRATPAPGGGPTPAPVQSPGTADNPRVIELHATQDLRWIDPSGAQVTSIALVDGEVVEFHIVNDSQAVPHNFHIGGQAELSTAPQDTNLPGTPTFTGDQGPQTVRFEVTSLPQQPQFACTVSGHYNSMHGDFVLTSAGGGTGGSPAPSATTSSPLPSPTTTP